MLYFPLESTALYFLFLYIFQISTHEIRTHPDARMLLLLCQAVMQDSYGFHISGGTVFRLAMQRLRPILLLTAHPVTYNFPHTSLRSPGTTYKFPAAYLLQFLCSSHGYDSLQNQENHIIIQ